MMDADSLTQMVLGAKGLGLGYAKKYECTVSVKEASVVMNFSCSESSSSAVFPRLHGIAVESLVPS